VASGPVVAFMVEAGSAGAGNPGLTGMCGRVTGLLVTATTAAVRTMAVAGIAG
jgi:hypothetical protein